MNRRRFPLVRTFSAALPLCLLWVFIGCVSLCLHHDEDSHSAAAINVLDVECDPDGCRVADDTEFVVPGRQLNIPHAGEGWNACPSSTPAQGVYASASPGQFEATPPSPSDSSPQKHCVLRI